MSVLIIANVFVVLPLTGSQHPWFGSLHPSHFNWGTSIQRDPGIFPGCQYPNLWCLWDEWEHRSVSTFLETNRQARFTEDGHTEYGYKLPGTFLYHYTISLPVAIIFNIIACLDWSTTIIPNDNCISNICLWRALIYIFFKGRKRGRGMFETYPITWNNWHSNPPVMSK